MYILTGCSIESRKWQEICRLFTMEKQVSVVSLEWKYEINML